MRLKLSKLCKIDISLWKQEALMRLVKAEPRAVSNVVHMQPHTPRGENGIGRENGCFGGFQN
jgi:hypothetical protein